MRDCQRPDGVLCLGLADYQLTVDPVDLLCDGDHPGRCVQVSPDDGQQFALPQSGSQFQVEQSEETAEDRLLRPTDTIQRTFSIASGLALGSAARIFIMMSLYTASLNSRRQILDRTVHLAVGSEHPQAFFAFLRVFAKFWRARVP